MHAGLARSLVFLVVLALVGTALLVLPRLNVPQIDAATPLSMSADGKMEHRLIFSSIWETAQIPTAVRFDSPLGTAHGDLDDPVFSTADGLVLDAGEPSPGWGKALVIGRRTPDGEIIHSMVAHLHRIDVAPGDLVARGSIIGAVGTANGHYPAHLHVEMRASDEVDIGAGYAAAPQNRVDPTATASALRNAADDDLSPSPLSVP